MDANYQLPGRVELDGDHEQSLEKIRLAAIEQNPDNDDDEEEANRTNSDDGYELEFYMPPPRDGSTARYLSSPIMEELQQLGADMDRDIARFSLLHQQASQASIIRPTEPEANGYGNCVPASAASVASLETHKYGGACAASDGACMCVICREDFEVGDDLSVLPCENRHRFHRSCLVSWLERSRFCPLCRHALPAAGDDELDGASSP